MVRLSNGLFCYILVCLVMGDDEPEVKTLYKRIKAPKKIFTFDYGIGLENTTIWYTQCYPLRKSKRDCALFVEKMKGNNATERNACYFPLQADTSNSILASYLRVFRFSSNRFLIFWIQYNPPTAHDNHIGTETIKSGMFVNIISMNWPSCLKTYSRIEGTILRPGYIHWADLKDTFAVHLYQNTFDVFYVDSESASLRQETFDEYGQLIRGPLSEENIAIAQRGVTVIPQLIYATPSKSCYLVWPQERIRIFRNFRDLSQDLGGLDNGGLQVRTSSNGNVSSCNNLVTETQYWRSCTQGEQTKNPKEFNLKFEYKPYISMIYNVPGGGLIALTTEYTFDETNSYSLHLTKFDVDGKAYEPVKVMNLKYYPQCETEEILLAHMFQDESGKFCLALLWENDTHYENLIKCYPEKYLSIEASDR
ncbi:hypothetical protein QAD02_012055 [Eretmocerus hayati]|uniref:Uncharacterized protein n=1 Tax=Eretmocerus hayati TaxID=131215 RepID=A0ACC2NYB3_9HYME|nr:hypothetical protein QAD02_012055 [Eretmocerus hayati]